MLCLLRAGASAVLALGECDLVQLETLGRHHAGDLQDVSNVNVLVPLVELVVHAASWIGKDHEPCEF